MEQENNTKINVSNIFLIFAIIIIFIMGYLLYSSKTKINEIINENSILSNSNYTTPSYSSPEKNISFDSLKGIYIGNIQVEPGTTLDNETEVSLYLYEDGSFRYYDRPGLGSGIVGYYTFNNTEIILHEILICANDVGRTITNNILTFKLDNNNSILDSNLNTVLTKSSQKIENKNNIISEDLKTAINNNALQ